MSHSDDADRISELLAGFYQVTGTGQMRQFEKPSIHFVEVMGAEGLFHLKMRCKLLLLLR